MPASDNRQRIVSSRSFISHSANSASNSGASSLLRSPNSARMRGSGCFRCGVAATSTPPQSLVSHQVWRAFKCDRLVSIDWTVKETSAGARLHFCWQERGSPPVREPAQKGFGSRLIGVSQEKSRRSRSRRVRHLHPGSVSGPCPTLIMRTQRTCLPDFIFLLTRKSRHASLHGS